MNRIGQSLASYALALEALQRASERLGVPVRVHVSQARRSVERATPRPPPPQPFYGDAIVLAPNGVGVWQMTTAGMQRIAVLPRYALAVIERFEGPYVWVRFQFPAPNTPRGTFFGEGYASFLDASTNAPNFQKIDTRVSGVDRMGQGLVSAALRLDKARAAAAAASRVDPFLRRPGDARQTSISVPAPRPQLTCTPRAGMNACNAFDLSTAAVVQVPRGTVVPAWPGPRGWFAGGTTIQIRLPNGHDAIAYGQDFVRAQPPTVSGVPRDQVGQGLVDYALRLDAAKRAAEARDRELAERVRRQQGLPTTPNPATKSPVDVLRPRLPGDEILRGSDRFDPTSSVRDRDTRVRLPDPNRPRLPSRAEMFRRWGIVEGPAVVERARGIQIWSAPAGEYRPGTNIPAMTRLFVLPQGTPVVLTPNEALITAVENATLFNSDGAGIGVDGSYFVRWDVTRNDVLAAAYQAVGIPPRGEGWARPYAPDGGAYFRATPVLT